MHSRPDTDLQDVYKLINVMENIIDTNEYQIFVCASPGSMAFSFI